MAVGSSVPADTFNGCIGNIMNEIIELPVRFRFMSGTARCEFNSLIGFTIQPSIGQHLIIETPEVEVIVIEGIAHFVSDKRPQCLIHTRLVNFENIDSLLMALDWFKAVLSIDDLRSDCKPPSYYILYRELINRLQLVHSPRIHLDTKIDGPALLECCRTLIKFHSNAYKWIDEFTTILRLEELLHEAPSHDLFLLIKRWETGFNKSGRHWIT